MKKEKGENFKLKIYAKFIFRKKYKPKESKKLYEILEHKETDSEES